MRRMLHPIVILSFVILAMVGVGCGSEGPAFVDDGRTYSTDSVTKLLEESELGDLTDRTTSEAEQLRQDALTGLRRRGDNAAQAASTITSAFPADATGVPYYVERAMYDDKSAWVILEARGRKGGHLGGRLLWVIDTNGDVLFSAMR